MDNPETREHAIKENLNKIREICIKRDMADEAIEKEEQAREDLKDLIEELEELIARFKKKDKLLHDRLNFMFREAKFFKTELKNLREERSYYLEV